MEVLRWRQARADSLRSLCQGDVPEGSSAEYSSLEQGPGGDSEAGSRRRLAVSDADRQPAAQVRSRTPQRSLKRAVAVCLSEIRVSTADLKAGDEIAARGTDD